MESNDIEEQILLYPDLSAGERERVEAFVRDHPDYGPLLEDVKALSAFLRDAAVLDEDLPDEGVVAYYAAMTYLPSRPIPEPLQRSFEHVEQAIRKNPTLREDVSRYRSRIEELDRGSNAVAQFEALTGRRLNRLAPDTPADHAGKAPDRPRRDVRRPWWYAAAAVLAGAALYGLLALVSRSTQSDLDRLAAIDPDMLEVSGYTVNLRGSSSAQAVESSDVLFLRGLESIQDAQTSVLGLFPGYDENELREAEDLLERVTQDPAAGNFLRLEAAFYLGKIRLALGDVAGAREALQTVVQGRGRLSGEAAQILQSLES